MTVSVVTVSQSPEKVERLEASVHASFGALGGAELIVLDGSQFDLFTGYNEGARRAQSNMLVFTHDDVVLWGNHLVFAPLLPLLTKPFTGLIGAAGSRQLPKDGCWWKSEMAACRGAVYHPAETKFGAHLNVWPWMAGQFGEVAVLDGVFLMIAKKQLEKLGGFAAARYQGFHFYDLDLSFRATKAGLKNYVAPIPLFHRSIGITSANWEENRQKFVSHFSGDLPFSL